MISKENYARSIANVDNPTLRKALQDYPAYTCWRDREIPAMHYCIQRHSLKDGVPVLTVVHGGDSTMPGYAVADVAPASLKRCECGKWQPATEAEGQRADAKKRLFEASMGRPPFGQA